ncbi:MAG: NAD(P)/FAD-dependent oxidoreductase [Oscillospiraceae bacterium]|jgi:predicted Rossmann fold flavoprotein|nr:NAD(P)/FAD-dependent oxidoreductase [Oscillospiraceae bacterium]
MFIQKPINPDARVAVIGGGPAGMAAALFAAECGASVTLAERNEKLGKKLYITGKGRCNITNMADAERTQANILRGAPFLRSALAAFDARALRSWLESLGLPTVEERGGRVFPASMKASDVTRALTREMEARGVIVMLRARVKSIKIDGGRASGVMLEDGRNIDCSAAILATGGLSYPATGSTGDGYQIAASLDHTIVPTGPALAPLESGAAWVRELQGLSLRNVTLRASWSGRRVMDEQGELLFTHFGISGPLALTLSSRIPGAAGSLEPLSTTLDLKPALSIEQVEARLTREFADNPRKRLDTVLCAMLPERFAKLFPELCGVRPDRAAAQITKDERRKVAETFKALRVPIDRLRGFDEAVITRGGVDLREIDPRTMCSKKIAGLYFAGEIIDADALTGGFNLQIAFSTGAKAGRSAASVI